MNRGPWIQTYTGKAFFPLDPRPEDIDIEDIAHALSHLCRYGGHCNKFYSVAQHSIHVAEALPDDIKLWGLLHDATEAYLVDVPRPIKSLLPQYKDIEANIWDAIKLKFGLVGVTPKAVHDADNAILVDEMYALMADPPMAWDLPVMGLDIDIVPWTSKTAKNYFEGEFYALTDSR